MMEPRRRKTLTPLESELRFDDPLLPRAPARATRLRRRLRRRRRPPTTWRGAVAQAATRVAAALAPASALAAAVDHYTHRSASFGFYCVGAFLLAVAVFTSGVDVGTPYHYSQGARERRVAMSFSYVFVGVVLLAVAVALDVFAT